MESWLRKEVGRAGEGKRGGVQGQAAVLAAIAQHEG